MHRWNPILSEMFRFRTAAAPGKSEMARIGEGGDAHKNKMGEVPECRNEKSGRCADDGRPGRTYQASEPTHTVSWKNIAQRRQVGTDRNPRRGALKINAAVAPARPSASRTAIAAAIATGSMRANSAINTSSSDWIWSPLTVMVSSPVADNGPRLLC